MSCFLYRVQGPSPWDRGVSILGSSRDVAPNLKFRAAKAFPLSQRLDYSLVHARPFLRQFGLQEGDLIALCINVTGGLVLTFETRGHQCPWIRSAKGKIQIEGRNMVRNTLRAKKNPLQSLDTASQLLDRAPLNGSVGFDGGATGEGSARYVYALHPISKILYALPA